MSEVTGKKSVSRFSGIIMALVCIVGLIPAIPVLAATSISGGYTERATAYPWGSYSDNKSITVTLPETEDDVWIKVTVPSGKRIFARCSYHNSNEGMLIEMRNSSNTRLDIKYSPNDVHAMDSVTPFMAVNCDNNTSTSGTYYVHVNRGSATGKLIFTITLKNRINSGRGVFNFSGTASNPGNTLLNISGVDSSILSLNLRNNTSIPPEAVVKHVNTAGKQSPNQGNVHHMILPATQTSVWYTATVTSSTSGSYSINVSDEFEANR